MSKRIGGIDKRLDEIKSQRKKLRREAGRVRSYLKITSSRGKKIRLTDVKQRASTGGSLNTNELSALLDSGSLTGISGEMPKSDAAKSQAPRRDRPGKKGRRRLGVTRGGPRKGIPQPAENEKNSLQMALYGKLKTLVCRSTII